MSRRADGGGLFPDAELAEDGVQQIFGGGLADDFSHGVGGHAKVQRRQFQAQSAAQRRQRALRRRARPPQARLRGGS